MTTPDRRPLLTMILALLLVSTTPVGTGAGVHQFDLVHPLFTHLHLYDGRMLTHEQLEETMTRPMARASRALPFGPSVAAGSAMPGDDAGVALSPTLPVPATPALLMLAARRLDIGLTLAHQLDEAPPDPPPPTAFV
jgi:hypothetical protein